MKSFDEFEELRIVPCLCVVPVGEECPDCGRVMTEDRERDQLSDDFADFVTNDM